MGVKRGDLREGSSARRERRERRTGGGRGVRVQGSAWRGVRVCAGLYHRNMIRAIGSVWSRIFGLFEFQNIWAI